MLCYDCGKEDSGGSQGYCYGCLKLRKGTMYHRGLETDEAKLYEAANLIARFSSVLAERVRELASTLAPEGRGLQ